MFEMVVLKEKNWARSHKILIIKIFEQNIAEIWFNPHESPPANCISVFFCTTVYVWLSAAAAPPAASYLYIKLYTHNTSLIKSAKGCEGSPSIVIISNVC